MKPAQAIETFLAVARNWRYLRFPTLTRPMIDATALPVRIGSDESSLSDAFLARVQSCYAHALEEQNADPSAIWKAMEDRNKLFLSALSSDDPAALRPFVETFYAGDMLMGMGHLQAFVKGRKTLYPRPYFGMRVRDSLMALGEALAVRGPPSNQQTPLRAYRSMMQADLAPLIADIETALGHEISVPQVGCPPGAEIAGRLFNPDLIRHAYVPHRLRQLGLKPDDPVLEIGGGYYHWHTHTVEASCGYPSIQGQRQY
ncbi:MAG: hypothetical protein AAF439_14920 [Pseudomonadota bacterium]